MMPDTKYDAFMSILRERASCRDYLDKPVPPELVDNCVEASRLAPSACNRQPWRFIIAESESVRMEICEKGLLPGISMPWLKKAPVIVALCAEKSFFTHYMAPVLSGVKYHLIDIGIAGEHFVLAAHSLGLGTCWIGWFNPRKVRKILNVPGSLEILSLISLGFPASELSQPPKLDMDKIIVSRL